MKIKSVFCFLPPRFCVLVPLCLAGTSVQAQDPNTLLIMKTEDGPPRVQAQSVDLVGASQLHEILGEDYVVMSDPEPTLPSTQPQPITLPPGTKPPIIPLCQCPEDYRASLELRLQTLGVEDILQPRQSFVLEPLISGTTPTLDSFPIPDSLTQPGLPGN